MTTCAQCSAIAIAVFLIGLALPTGAQAREAPSMPGYRGPTMRSYICTRDFQRPVLRAIPNRA